MNRYERTYDVMNNEELYLFLGGTEKGVLLTCLFCRLSDIEFAGTGRLLLLDPIGKVELPSRGR